MAWYRVSTCSLTSGSPTVTGAGTAWVANAQAGDAFKGPDDKLYEVQSVNSDTSITLASNYAGSTASSQAYAIIPTQGRVRDLAAQVVALITSYGAVNSALTVDTGRVGLGKSPNAAAKLDVSGEVRVDAPTGDATLRMLVSGVEKGKLAVTSAGRGYVESNGAEVMTWLSGNVGVGTSAPAARLHVAGDIQQDNSTYLKGKTAGGSTTRLLGINGANDIYLGSVDVATGGEFIFINGAERVRIDASGNLCIGTSTQLGKLTVANSVTNTDTAAFQITSTAGPNYGIIVNSLASAANTAALFRGWAAGVAVFNVGGNGNVLNTNNSYGALSDAKLKENIVAASPVLSRLMQVLIRNYNLIGDPTHRQLGVVAQELEQVFPGLIEDTPDYTESQAQRVVQVAPVLDDTGATVAPATTRTENYTKRLATGTSTKSVKYSVFVPMLIKGMQEQQEQIDAIRLAIEAAGAPPVV